ncbi:helix-turn-helix domain-containing protein [Burkholderia pseudomallei]|uniref:helix-turn-helix domain-containing protein n=1 Tax=Burkholderia pseudomallei TaxID=28450 RepID=UPI001AD6CA62|nr:helix-turn-helix domain-containing protein [Burkholderia pseudomallei]
MVEKHEATLSLLARRAQQLRKQAGLTQDGLARNLGRHRSLVSAVETGRKNLSLDTVDLIASTLGVEAVSLFEDRTVERDARNAELLRERVSRNVQTLRNKRGMSQDELSESADLWRGYVAYLESRKANADLAHLEKLANALGVSVGTLLAPPGAEEKAIKP